LKAPDKAAFRTAHAEEISRYERSRELLKTAFPDDNFPSMKALKTKKTGSSNYRPGKGLS